MRYIRRVIRITADDSPNVRRELARRRGDPEASWPEEIPGVLSWEELQKRLALWDEIRQCIGLRAQFYEGAGVLLFPPMWLNRAEQIAEALKGKPRKALAVGVDPAEGGDSTSMAAADELGLIELVSRKTPDTSVVTSEALAFMRKHGVAAEKVFFDRGGGGKEHADRLRSQGHQVQTVAFGESLIPDPRRGVTPTPVRLDNKEERYAFVNRRAEMYHALRQLLDPSNNPRGFGIPAEYTELRRQLAPIPLTYDGEGRLRLLPKSRRSANSTEKTLTELIGRSPDDADALVLAAHALLHKPRRARAGVS